MDSLDPKQPSHKWEGFTACLINWADSNEILPPKNADFCDRWYIVSDGKNIGLAIWTNDIDYSDDDVILDEYHFMPIAGAWVQPRFWFGHVEGTEPPHLKSHYINKVVPAIPSMVPLGNSGITPPPQTLTSIVNKNVIQEEEKYRPAELSTYEKLIEVGFSEVLSEKICTGNKNLNIDEVRIILANRRYLPCSYLPTFHEVVLPMALDHLGIKDG